MIYVNSFADYLYRLFIIVGQIGLLLIFYCSVGEIREIKFAKILCLITIFAYIAPLAGKFGLNYLSYNFPITLLGPNGLENVELGWDIL